MASSIEEGVVNKRKADSVSDDEESSKKQKLCDLSFTEIDFKLKLKDDETITDGLEEFVKVAEAHSDGVECTDIVSRYCISSPECSELLGLLDITQKKLGMGQVTLVYECLTQILKYIQSDVGRLRSTGDTIVQKFLSARLGQMYNYLKNSNRSATIKKTLKLLIAMATLNDKTKKAMQARFNFDHQVFPELFQRRNRQDPEDVRSCLVLFAMSFIVEGDGELINAFVQQKGFIQMTLTGLMFDPKEMVMDVLATLLEKVVKNSDVTKTAKIKLFNENVLKQICDLYDWEGHQGWNPKKVKKRNVSEKEFLTNEDFLEDKAMVVDVLHEFLLAVCSSQKHGIIFFDKTVGTGSRNCNVLLTHLLQSLVSGLENPLRRNLAVRILNSCPDQLFHFLSAWEKTLTSRWSDKWALAMNFLVEIYENLDPIPSFLSNADLTPKDVDSLVSLMNVYYLPCQKVATCIMQGIKSDDLRVRHHCLLLMQVILKNCTAILRTLTTNINLTLSVEESVNTVFSSLVVKTLPTSGSLFTCVDKVLEVLSSPKKMESIGVEVDLVEHVATVLKTLSLFQALSLNLLSDRPKDVSKLVEAVRILQAISDESMKDVSAEDKMESKNVLPQLDLLKLLSETDAKTLSLSREGLLEKLLRSAHQCLKEQHKEETISLICKMLTSFEVLSDHQQELHLWIDLALTSECNWRLPDTPSPFSPIAFLANCLSTLINNPVPYLDKVMEIVAEASDTPSGAKDDNDDDMNSSATYGLKDADIQDILKTKEEDLVLTNCSNLLETQSSNALPFSPLSVIALEKLQYFKGDKSSVGEYVSVILLKMVHGQTNPIPYSVMVTSNSMANLADWVVEYLNYWTGRKKPSKNLPVTNLKLMNSFSCGLLNFYISGDDEDRLQDLKTIPREDKLSCLKQAIFYLDHCMSPNFTLGVKMIRVRILRNIIEGIFTSYVDECQTLGEEDMESDDKDEDENDNTIETDVNPEVEKAKHDEKLKAVEQISIALLFVANNPTFKRIFINSSTKNTLSPSKLDKTKKLEASISKMICNIFVACKNLDLSPSCHETLQIYLDLALDRMLKKKSCDLDTCLTAVEAIAGHLNLPIIDKCVSTFLKFPSSTYVSEDDGRVDKVPTGQRAKNLSVTGKTFLQLLTLWAETLNLYQMAEVKDTYVLLTLFSSKNLETVNAKTTMGADTKEKVRSKSDDTSSQSYDPRHPSNSRHVTSTELDVSDLKSLLDLLLVCSNFDSIVCRIISHLPHLSMCCDQKVFETLIKNYTSLEQDRRTLLEAMMSSLDAFHQVGGSYVEKNINAIIKKGHFSLLKAYLDKPGGDAEIIQMVCQKLLGSCKEILPNGDENLWGCLHALVGSGHGGDNFCNDLSSAVTIFITGNRSSTNIHHFSILNDICKYVHSSCQGKPDDNKLECNFLEIVLKFIIHLLSKKSNRNIELEDKLIHLAIESLKRGGVLLANFISSCWATVAKSLLKHLYSNSAALDLLSRLSSLVHISEKKEEEREKDEGHKGKVNDIKHGGMNLEMIFQMCVSHTAFLSTLISTSDISTKDALVHLLFTLFSLNPTCCAKKELLSPLVGAYSATLSLTNQRLLKMMVACLSETDSESSENFPILWGKAYLDHKATAKTLGPSLDTEVSMKSFLGEIDSAKMKRTILHFAMTRNTKRFNICQDLTTLDFDCYDPNYLLRVFLQLLSSDKIVPVRQFVLKDCLSFLVICLSSYHAHCRLMAYQCLNEFYGHLENSGCPERHEFAFILDLLNASRVQTGQRLPYVVVLFLTRAFKLMLDPSDPMYLPIIRFLAVKPEMDLNGVPEFYNLFFSTGSHYAKERNWMISLLRDGIRDSSDYWLYQKRLIFRLVMSFYSSSVSDKLSQVLALEMVRNACRQKLLAKDLVKDHGLIPWLSCVVGGLQERPEHAELVSSILDTLCCSLELTSRVTKINMQGCKGSGSSISQCDTSEVVDKLRAKEKKGETNEGDLGISDVVGLDSLVKTFNSFVSSQGPCSNLETDLELNPV